MYGRIGHIGLIYAAKLPLTKYVLDLMSLFIQVFAITDLAFSALLGANAGRNTPCLTSHPAAFVPCSQTHEHRAKPVANGM